MGLEEIAAREARPLLVRASGARRKSAAKNLLAPEPLGLCLAQHPSRGPNAVNVRVRYGTVGKKTPTETDRPNMCCLSQDSESWVGKIVL